MKKSIIAIAVCLFGLTQMSAQVTFRPGIKAGLNFSHFSKGNDYYNDGYYDNNGDYVYENENKDFHSKTDFYLGFYGALKLTKYYTLQPEINYSRQGTSYEPADFPKEKLDVSYLSLGLVNKFTFTDRFNVHIGSSIDFVVEDNFNTDNELDLAFVLGAGYNFNKNFGIEARVKKGIVPVIDYSNNHSNVVFQFGGTYTFDIK